VVNTCLQKRKEKISKRKSDGWRFLKEKEKMCKNKFQLIDFFCHELKHLWRKGHCWERNNFVLVFEKANENCTVRQPLSPWIAMASSDRVKAQKSKLPKKMHSLNPSIALAFGKPSSVVLLTWTLSGILPLKCRGQGKLLAKTRIHLCWLYYYTKPFNDS